MRCPYCGGLNVDQAQFCRYCGRGFGPPTSPGQPAGRQTPPQRPPYQQPQLPGYAPPKPPEPITPVQAPSYRRPDPQPPTPPEPQYAAGSRRRRQSSSAPTAATLNSTAPTAPEPPAPFPPRSMDQLQALEPGALPYTLISDEVGIGRKKIVRISFPRCAAWQQVATLQKAFKEYQTEQFDTIVIQGLADQDSSVYNYTNGQLWFDRRVRLGSQLINRYQIETGTGMESDAVRIVLAEE